MTYTQFRQSIPVDEARDLLIRAGLTPLNVVCLHEEVIAAVEPILSGKRVVDNQVASIARKLEKVNCLVTMFDAMENRVHFRVMKEAQS